MNIKTLRIPKSLCPFWVIFLGRFWIWICGVEEQEQEQEEGGWRQRRDVLGLEGENEGRTGESDTRIPEAQAEKFCLLILANRSTLVFASCRFISDHSVAQLPQPQV